jgi:transcriptional regulator with XRE-family HTH domain
MTKAEKETLKIKFGKVVRDTRNSMGLPLRELARRCKMNDSNISKIENGRRESSLTTTVKLARGLELPLAELFRRLGEPPKPLRIDLAGV